MRRRRCRVERRENKRLRESASGPLVLEIRMGFGVTFALLLLNFRGARHLELRIRIDWNAAPASVVEVVVGNVLLPLCATSALRRGTFATYVGALKADAYFALLTLKAPGPVNLLCTNNAFAHQDVAPILDYDAPGIRRTKRRWCWRQSFFARGQGCRHRERYWSAVSVVVFKSIEITRLVKLLLWLLLSSRKEGAVLMPEEG